MKIFNFLNSKQIRDGAIGSLGIKFLSALFVFLSSIMLARTLGLEQFGIYTLVFATVLMLTIPVSFGLPNLIIRYISKYEVEANNSAIKGLLIRADQYVFLCTLLIWAIAILSYFIWWKNYNSSFVEALWYGLLLIPIIVLGTFKGAALRGLRYIILGQISDTLLRNALLFLGVAVYYILDLDLTPAKVIIIHLIAATIAFLLGSVFLRNKLRSKLTSTTPVFFNKIWFREALPFAVNSGVQVSKSKIISYILAAFSGVKAVAIFDIALRASALVSFTLDAVNSAIAPYISNAFENKNSVSLQRILRKSSLIIFLSAIPIVLVFILGGRPLLVFLFGVAYEASFVPLVILCVGQLVNTAAGSVGIVMYMTGNQRYFTKVVTVITILYAIFSIPFVIFFDEIGAAIILSLLLIIQNVVLVIYVKNKLKINTTIFFRDSIK